MQDNSTIDFSKFPVGRQKNPDSQNHKVFLGTMSKRDRIYAFIFIAALILTIILSVKFFSKQETSRGSEFLETPPSADEENIIFTLCLILI